MANEHDDWIASVARGDYNQFLGVGQPAEVVTAKPREQSGVLRRAVGDTLVSGLKGAIAVPEAAVGLADIPTGGAVGKALEGAGFRPKEAKATLETMYSPEYRRTSKALAATEGFLPTAEYMLRNPSTIYHATVESAPLMLAGGAAGRGVRAATGAVPWVAGAVGEGVVGGGLAAEQIRQQTEDGTLTPKQALAAAASGVGTAAIGAVGGKLASKYGVGDVETMLAQGSRSVGARKGAIRRVAEGALTEGAIEELPQSAQEQVWQNLALGRPAFEGVPEAAAQGMLAGGVMGGGVNLLARAPAEPIKPTETVSYPAVSPTGKTPDMFTGELGEGKDQYTAAMEDAIRVTNFGQGELFDFGMYRTTAGGAPTFGVTTGRKPWAAGTESATGVGKVTKAQLRKAEREARAAEKAAAKAEAAAAKTTKPTKRQDIIATLDDHLANGRITEDQHAELVSDAENTTTNLEKVRKNIEAAVLSNQPSKQTAVATVEEATASLAKFEESLPGQQKEVFSLINEAAKNNELDQFISPDGKWQSKAIADKLGFESRQAAHKAVRDLRKKLGPEVQQALAMLTSAVRTYEAADESKLGLPPAQQASVLSEEDIFGAGEGAAAQGYGVIEGVGGSQSAVGESELPPGYTPTDELTARAVEAAKETKVRIVVEAAQDGTLVEAVNTWNDFVGEVPGVQEITSALSVDEENIDFMAELVGAYADVRDKVDAYREAGKFIDEVGEYEYEVRRIVRERERRAQKMVGSTPREAGEIAGEGPGTGQSADADGRVAEKPTVGAGREKGVTVAKKKTRKFSVSDDASKAVAGVEEELVKGFMSPASLNKVAAVVGSPSELPKDLQSVVLSVEGKVKGFYDEDSNRVYLIAENIKPGEAMGVFLHEVGVHMGMKKLLGERNYSRLVDQLQTWVLDGSGVEGELARQARTRVRAAEEKIGMDYTQDEFDEELLAYFVEVAVNRGIDPTMATGYPNASLREWFRLLISSIKKALVKLGVNAEKLTAQDVVDLAYGAANIEMEPTSAGASARGKKMSVSQEGAPKTTTYYSKYAMEKAEKFLKKQGLYQTISVVKTPEGTYEVTRIKPTSGRMFSVAAEGSSLPEAVEWNQKTIKKAIADQAKHMANVGLDKVMFTEDLIERAVRRGLTSAEKFGKLMAEKMATRDSMEQEVANTMSRAFDLGEEKDTASDFIYESTRSQKWGFAPEWDKEAVVDPGMATKFRKLSTRAQAVVIDVFKFGHESHTRLQKAINQDIHDEFDALAAEATTADEKADIEKRRQLKLAQVGKLVPKLDGPYAPLKRFGNHVMVAMSQEYAAAKKAGDTKRMEELQDDERHLLVEHLETRAEALARVDQLRGLYRGGSVDTWTKQESYKHVTELPWAGVAKVKAAIEGLPEDSKLRRSMQHMVTDLYLTMMAESSARKSEMRRRNVVGANKDMFRSFASQGSATAHFITSLENGGDISRAMVEMQRVAREGDEGTRNDRTAVLNELTARYAQTLEYSDTPMVNRALKLTSFWMLITSPAFYVQNALQPFMITIPYLAGRFGGSRAWSTMAKAYQDVSKYVVSVGTHQMDIDKLQISAAEKNMLRQMQKYGKLDLTIMQDMGRYTEGEGVLDKGVFGKVMRKIWAGPQRVELLNRVASALAAYRLSTGAEEARLKYVGEVISKTHGNYSSFNAPRFFTKSGAMRLITQFRKFQLIQLTLLARLTHDAFKGATQEERAVAKRAMYWLLGQGALMTGALGLPIPAVVWAIAAALGGDDGEDPEQWLRNMTGDEDAANLLTRGVPAYFGLNLSQKIGMGSTFSALPFADIPKDKAGYEKFLTASLGPAAAVGGQWFDALGKLRKGEYYKGVETALPRGIKDGMAAYRFATDGVTAGNNDVLLSPEDIGLVDVMAKGLGLPTMTITERQRKQGVLLEAEKFFGEKVSNIKREYAKAYNEKDRATMASLRAEWKQIQDARVAQGFSRQPVSELLRAPRDQAKREKDVVEGLATTKQNRKFVEEMV